MRETIGKKTTEIIIPDALRDRFDIVELILLCWFSFGLGCLVCSIFIFFKSLLDD